MNVSVEFIRHTEILCNAPLLISKPRDEYRFVVGSLEPIKRDCWWWWRDIDGVIHILGGGGGNGKGGNGKTQIPTIYILRVIGGKLSCCCADDQSRAWDLYNEHGAK